MEYTQHQFSFEKAEEGVSYTISIHLTSLVLRVGLLKISSWRESSIQKICTR